jgi:hypothetical protein
MQRPKISHFQVRQGKVNSQGYTDVPTLPQVQDQTLSHVHIELIKFDVTYIRALISFLKL